MLSALNFKSSSTNYGKKHNWINIRMFCISNKIASIPSRKISRYRIWKENTVARCIYTMASYRIKMRSVQIPRTIETKNSNIAFECLPVLHSLHSIMEVVGSLKLLPHMNTEEKKKSQIFKQILHQCQCHKWCIFRLIYCGS